MSTDSIDLVVQLNNEGVSLLASGQDREAAVSLTQSLNIIQKSLSSQLDRAPSTTEASSSFRTTRTTLMKGGEQSSNDVSTTTTPTPAIYSKHTLANLQDDSCYFIYNKAVMIYPDAARESPEMLHVYSASIILNLALVYHRQGRKGHNKFCIQKAEKFYRMVNFLLKECPLEDPTAVFIRLVAVNNLSHIHYEQQNFEQTREGLEWLSFLIQKVEPNRSSLLEQADLDLLLMNVLLLMNSPNAAPAA